MFKILIFILIINKANAFYENNDISKDIITKGKEMYELLLKRGDNERYGKCWYNAVRQFEQGCNKMSENLQVKLAIGFANCFLAMTDQTQIDCDRDEKLNLRRICFEELKDRAFLTFTEFYTHTQNMCFFLRNQLWHKETEETIDLLSEISRHVAAKLTLAEAQQQELLKHQQIGLELQKQIYEHGSHLSQSLHESRENFETLTHEIRLSTIENNEMVMELFGKIQSIQSWMLGEYTAFNAVLYYSAFLMIIIIFTSSHRTMTSRLPVLLILSISILVEYAVRVWIISKYDIDMMETKAKLDLWIWNIRKFFIVFSILICLMNAIKFRDLNEKNNIILEQLIKQNAILSGELNDVKDIILKGVGKTDKNVCRILPRRPVSRAILVVTPIMDVGDDETEEDSEEENQSYNSRNSLTPVEFGSFNSDRYPLRNRSITAK